MLVDQSKELTLGMTDIHACAQQPLHMPLEGRICQLVAIPLEEETLN